MASADTDRLLLRLDSEGRLSWLGGTGRAVPGVPPRQRLDQARRIVVLVPSEDVLLTGTTLSARSQAQLLRALPFAVEDGLLAPVEDLHVVPVVVPGLEGDRRAVLVVARTRLREWLDRLAADGIRPDVLIPETLALLPATALIEADRALVRLAPDAAFACPAADLADWLRQTGVPAADLTVHDLRPAATGPAPIGATSSDIRSPGSLQTGDAPHPGARDGLGLLAPSLPAAGNLLEGAFAPAHRRAAGSRLWRLAAALAALVVLLGLTERGLGVLQLRRESAALQAAIDRHLHEALPELDGAALAGVEPGQLLQRRLETLRGGSDEGLLGLLGRIAPVLTSGTRIQTRGIEYRNGALELGLRAPDVQALDALRERLAMLPGLRAEITGTSPADGAQGGVDARIRVSGAGA
ncbi:MAG TPA: type II secretion system protein GspL [Dokdonella sp.]|uniref:type II secretion system protein GspL n=1 Tax=Dokdonella sp. TaxID=2291710 RepID=UPI002C592DD9|nr:type II secretion system protein GspL [Dokdonella sp.]HUD42456.1 type II secretion system protein GspL [Dokdonella sp.]